MRTFLTLWCKELATAFLSPIAYAVITFCLVITGYSFWMIISVLIQANGGSMVMGNMFGSIFYWISLLAVIPILTMRTFAEEKRAGTLETLMTAPVTDVQVVLAKYMGTLTIFILMWLPTAAYAFILKAFDPQLKLDIGPLLSGYLGTLLIGSFYLSLGIFSSALTKNQIVSAITCFAFIVAVFFAGFVPFYAHTSGIRDVGTYFSSTSHMLEFSRGLIDSRQVVFYVSCTVCVLFATVRIIESRKWK